MLFLSVYKDKKAFALPNVKKFKEERVVGCGVSEKKKGGISATLNV
jgi:hypothetical protein